MCGGGGGGGERRVKNCVQLFSGKQPLTFSGGTEAIFLTLLFISGTSRWMLTLSESFRSLTLISAMEGLFVKSSFQHLQ